MIEKVKLHRYNVACYVLENEFMSHGETYTFQLVADNRDSIETGLRNIFNPKVIHTIQIDDLSECDAK